MMKAEVQSGSAIGKHRRADHIAAAALLVVTVCGIYGRITWGMFLGSHDYQAHLLLARLFYEQPLQQMRHPAVPHFLFHAITAGLYAARMTPSLLAAARMVMLGSYALAAALVYWLLYRAFAGSWVGAPWILFTAGLTLMMAQPITNTHAYTLGYFWLEPYQIPTSVMLKPFALLSFALAAEYLPRNRPPGVRTAGLAAATVAGAWTKPSFLICLLPATAALVAWRWCRRAPCSIRSLTVGLFVPGGLMLAWQCLLTYAGAAGGGYRDSIAWAPLKFMHHYASWLSVKLLLSIAFPLAVTALDWRRARRDSTLQLGWMAFGVGAFCSYTLVERINWASGNFTWSGHIALFTLFFASVVFWLRGIAAGPSRTGLLCGALLALHLISGARVDWFYLSHYGCTLNFLTVEFVCKP